MICNYCTHSPSKLHHHYNIEQVKERFNPTYSHTHIFNPNGDASHSVRCTPTFHSTAFDVGGYRPLTNQHLKRQNEQKKPTEVHYKNVSLSRKQEELNPTSRDFDLNLKGKWYDPAKQELFNSLQCFSERYSRERKLADLSSNPVFGGVTLEVVPKASQIHAQIKESTPICTKEEPEQEVPKEEKPIQLESAEHEHHRSQQQAQPCQKAKEAEVKSEADSNKHSNTPPEQPKKQQDQKFSIKNEITFGKKEGAGRRLLKTANISSKPAFTVIKSRRG